MDGQLLHMLDAQVPQRVGTHQLVDLLHRMAGGDQVFFVGDVGAEIAGVGERRGADAVVYLGGASLAQQADGAGTGGAAHDGVIHQHDALALDRGGDGVQLDADAALALGLAALNEGAADIFVLDKAYAVGDAALLGVTQGGVQAGIRRADDDVGLDGMLLRQETAGLQAGLMDAGALDDGIRAGKVDVLEHAHRVGGGAAVILDAAQTVVVSDDDLTGLDVPYEFGADGVQGAALAGKGPAGTIGQLADAQRAEAVGVTGGDQLGMGHDDQRIRALDVVHRAADGHLNVGGQQAVLGQQVGDDLGIRGTVEDGTAHLQLTAQLGGVDQVAVVAYGHGTLAVMQNHRLRVGTAALACGGVTHVAGGHLGAAGQVLQHALGEHLAHQPQVAVAGKHTVHVQGDAAAFLPAMLQGVQRTVHGTDHIGRAGLIVHAKDTALLVQALAELGNFAHSMLRSVCGNLAQQALHNFLVGISLAAQVAAEQVLVQMCAGGGIPETAGVGADLVGQDDGAVGQAAELDLEVDQADVGIQQDLLQHFVDLEGVLGDGIDLFLGGQAESQGIVVVDERIMQVVVLVAELQDGGLELGTLGHAHAQGEVAGGDVADDDLQGHDLDLLYKGVAVVDLLHIVGGDALFLQLLHQGIGQLVVHDALVADGALLLAVTGGGIVLVVDHYDLGVAGSENLLGFAFVHLLFNFVIHRKTLLFIVVYYNK